MQVRTRQHAPAGPRTRICMGARRASFGGAPDGRRRAPRGNATQETHCYDNNNEYYYYYYYYIRHGFVPRHRAATSGKRAPRRAATRNKRNAIMKNRYVSMGHGVSKRRGPNT